MKKHEGGKNLAGLLFTAAMALCCIGLCLWGEREQDEMAKAAAAEAADNTAQKARAYPSENVFFHRVGECGFDGDMTEKQSRSHSKVYILERGELPSGELVLSMKNGGVCAFTITLPAAKEPGPLGTAPSDVEVSLYEQRAAAWELEKEWFSGGFRAFLEGLDIMGEITYADITSMLSYAGQTNKDGRERSMKSGNFEFRAVILSEGEGDKISVSLIAEE